MNNDKNLSMADIQKVSLEILKTISNICEKNNFKYFLAYGTLIGAIRHKGYIPWDDDVDIMMPRPDYERLLHYLEKHSRDLGHLKLFTPQLNPNYPYMLARISDDRYWIDVKNEKRHGMGIFIDIYPLDGLGNTHEEALTLLKKTTKLCSMIFISTRESFHIDLTKGFFRKFIKYPAYIYAKAFGKNYFVRKLQNELNKCSYENSNIVGAAAWCTRPLKNIYMKEWCVDLMLSDFEDTQFYIPVHYDNMLKVTYGNYMQLPPQKDRIYHHLYKAYKKES